MNTINKTLLGALALVLVFAALCVAFIAVTNAPRDAHANAYSATILGAATTSTAIAVTTSTRILATSTPRAGGQGYLRTYADICNSSANVVYLGMNNDKAVNASTTGGIPIAAAAGFTPCYEISEYNLYQGSVQASSTSGISTVLYVQEYVQQ